MAAVTQTIPASSEHAATVKDMSTLYSGGSIGTECPLTYSIVAKDSDAVGCQGCLSLVGSLIKVNKMALCDCEARGKLVYLGESKYTNPFTV